MRSGTSNNPIAQALSSVGAWVLDVPLPAALIGQRCDRLRPFPIGHELRAALQANGQGTSDLVEWHWDQRLARADGWLWNRGVLLQFRWWRRDGRMTLRQQLECTTRSSLQVVP